MRSRIQAARDGRPPRDAACPDRLPGLRQILSRLAGNSRALRATQRHGRPIRHLSGLEHGGAGCRASKGADRYGPDPSRSRTVCRVDCTGAGCTALRRFRARVLRPRWRIPAPPLAAGSTSIGNLGQYFTFRLPGFADDVAATEATVTGNCADRCTNCRGAGAFQSRRWFRCTVHGPERFHWRGAAGEAYC